MKTYFEVVCRFMSKTRTEGKYPRSICIKQIKSPKLIAENEAVRYVTSINKFVTSKARKNDKALPLCSSTEKYMSKGKEVQYRAHYGYRKGQRLIVSVEKFTGK